MARLRRVVFAVLFGGVGSIVPVTTFAGGGVAPSGGGGHGGGGAPAAAMVSVDHAMLRGFDFLDYYPRSATVHEGDTVNFHWTESNGSLFHTVTFVPAGTALTQQAISRLFPGGGRPIPDKDDPGHPGIYFSFNALQRPCGNSPYFPGTAPCSFDGRSVVNSGVEFPNAVVETGKFYPTGPLHWSVTMNVRPGVYHYFCLVHGPGMNGTITVVPPGTAVTTRAQGARDAAAQFQSQAAQVAAVYAHVPPPTQQIQGGHTTWTMTAGLNAPPTARFDPDAFSAPNLSIKAGDTVVWQPRGFHTVTFPRFAGVPSTPLECEAGNRPDRTVTSIVRGCNLEITIARGTLPSGPSGAAYTGGFLNSGALVLPSPHAWSVSFPKAGTYRYQCLVHWGMFGTINVR